VRSETLSTEELIAKLSAICPDVEYAIDGEIFQEALQ
jgi:hypothetical protein